MRNELRKPSTIEYEQHEVLYRRWYIDDQGKRHLVEEPIEVSYSIVLGTGEWIPRPYVVNELIDKIKFMLLDRMGGKENGIY